MVISGGFPPQKIPIRKEEKMIKSIGLFWGIVLLLSESGMAQTPSPSGKTPKEETMEIQTDMLPPASAEKVVPTHPFFAAPTAGSEVMEKLEELDERVSKLEKKEKSQSQ